MTAPVRLRLSRARGFNLQAHSLAINGLAAVNCARPSQWGNDFTGDDCVYCYRTWLIQAVAITGYWRAELDKLRGKNLACWCDLVDERCHADLLLELANKSRQNGDSNGLQRNRAI